ncbi:MAG: ParB/RepB/Spo0J family partition protein [Anaerolineales bacterium]|jgi:ParB family chromosome partitioning protein
MPQRPGLGKGLDALIPSSPATQSTDVDSGGVLQLPADAIVRNPRQPRKSEFDEKDLDELATSIQEHGIIQPLIVSKGEGENYILIAGERRLRAAKKVGLRTVPAILRQANDRELLELALIENIQRADLNPLEEADAYRQLTEDFGLSHEKVAQRVGKSRPAISNTLRLLQLSDTVKAALIDSYSHADEKDQDPEHQAESKFRLSEGHARALLHLSTHQAQDAALKTVEKGKLNVRQTEELVKRWGGEKKASAPPKAPSPEVNDLERRLESSLETDVKLRHGKKGGTITIRYYSDEELDKLLGRLL